MYSHFGADIPVTPFGLIFLLAILTCWLLARRNASGINIHGSHIDLLIPIALIAGVTGGASLSLIMPMDRLIAGEDMQAVVRVRFFSMLAIGAMAVFIYSRVARLPFRRLLDVLALPTLAGLMIHRLGCFIAGCCWGDTVSSEHATRFASQIQTLPFLGGMSNGVRYPPGSLPYEQHLAMGLIEPNALASLPVYPVQLYEGALLLLALLALWRFPRARYEKGVLSILVVCAYAVIRFFIEYLRADGVVVFGILTITQLQCLVLLLSGFLLPKLPAVGKRRPAN